MEVKEKRGKKIKANIGEIGLMMFISGKSEIVASTRQETNMQN
jgi:hypothetical protein